MWGCIVNHNTSQSKPEVPSLYVRVYRCGNFSPHASGCSLTMREGVSTRATSRADIKRFPHYAWGCIVHCMYRIWERTVPSLCVRVYREIRGWIEAIYRSLTMREGVSDIWVKPMPDSPFPHYAWGCITVLLPPSLCPGVPSLYVRVYRQRASRITHHSSSIIIYECI